MLQSKEIAPDIAVINHQLSRLSATKYLSPCSTTSLYEVIRVIDKTPLFLEDHFERLRQSVQKVNNPYEPDFQSYTSDISLLINNTDITNGNIRLQLDLRDDNNNDIFMNYIPHRYPKESAYAEGVDVKTWSFKRPIPGAKIVNSSFKDQVESFIEENNIYEALLVTEENIITEGSRTNLFFIKGNMLFTAPSSSVLRGITRKYTMQICYDLDFPVAEKDIRLDKINEYDSAFITGTSAKILPLRSINGMQLKVSNGITNMLIREYNRLIENYIETKRYLKEV